VAEPVLPPAPIEPVAIRPADPPKAEPPKAEPPKVETPAAVAPPPGPASPAAPATEGKSYGIPAGEARVVVRAINDDCWIQVREMDGSLMLSRLLRRGDVVGIPNRPGLTLMAGNAGALEVSVDGRKVPALGAIGQVRRDVKLDPDRLGGGG
jgi:cytoskeleton protein RodZ